MKYFFKKGRGGGGNPQLGGKDRFINFKYAALWVRIQTKVINGMGDISKERPPHKKRQKFLLRLWIQIIFGTIDISYQNCFYAKDVCTQIHA